MKTRKGSPRAHHLATGKRFGLLTVIERDGHIHGSAAWLCQCECGNTCRVRYTSLRRGEIVSCGCRKKQVLDRRTHGMKRTPEYRSWSMAKERTSNPNHKSFKHYGGRGISMCERWRESFEAFFEDMGPRPSICHSLDRHPDQNGNYEPGNCRWATWTEQANNRRNTHLITIDGRTQPISAWAAETGLSHGCILQRVTSGRTGSSIVAPANRARRHLTAQGREDAP